MSKEIGNIKGIRTVKDLMRATIPKGATLENGGYDLFTEGIKKYLICEGGNLMTWDDWYKKPHPLISTTEDIPHEEVKPLIIESGSFCTCMFRTTSIKGERCDFCKKIVNG